MAYPTITETHGFVHGRRSVAESIAEIRTAFKAPLPMTDQVAQEDPGWFSGLPIDACSLIAEALAASDSTVTPEEVPGGVSDDH